MTVLRIKGLKRYRAKGRWYAYHRKTGIRLKAEFGTGEFIAELASIERKLKITESLPGTLGLLLSSYRSSPAFTDLAPASQRGYGRMMNLLKPLDAMPLVELSSQFVAGLRDRVAAKHGRRQGNLGRGGNSVALSDGNKAGELCDGGHFSRFRARKRTRHRLGKSGQRSETGQASEGAKTANRPWTLD